MARALADYHGTFNKITDSMPTGKTIQATAPEIAVMVGEPPGRVVRVLEVMKRVGAMKFEYDEKRKPHYTLVDSDFDSVERRMREKGIAWSAYQEQTTSLSPEHPKPQNGVVRSFAELSPLRKSEPRAELEIARKYRDQQAFVAAKRAEFQTMGLDMPEPTPLYDADRRRELDAIVRILPYVESIEKANTSLEEQNKTIRAPMGELNDLRARVARQTTQIETLVREKGEIKDDVQRVLDDHRREVKGYRDQIGELEGQLRQLRGSKAVNQAIATVTGRSGEPA